MHKVYFTLLNEDLKYNLTIREIYLLEQKRKTNALTEPLLTIKRQDLGVRTLRFKDEGRTTLVSLDSLVSIAPNSVAGFVFEYRTAPANEPNTKLETFKVHPDSTKDYLVSKLKLNVEFYNADSPDKTDTLSAYVFSRVF